MPMVMMFRCIDLILQSGSEIPVTHVSQFSEGILPQLSVNFTAIVHM